MDWTKPIRPTKENYPYNHTITITPIGIILVEWKKLDYMISIDHEWIGTASNLKEAEEMIIKYLKKKSKELIKYLTDL